MGRSARSVAIVSAKMWMVNRLLLVMFVHFQFADLAMNTRGRMVINLALNAKQDTGGTKVC